MAFFKKSNQSILGRPKTKKPKLGSFYLGAGVGVPMYGLTNVNETYVNDSATSAIRSSSHSATETMPVTLPIIRGQAGYMPISMPIKHEASFTFVDNAYSISTSADITINGNPYTTPKISMQMFFIQYYLYAYQHIKILPIYLFAGAGGGLVVLNTSLSDSSTTRSTSSDSTTTTATSTPSSSPSMSGLSVAGSVGATFGASYLISDDMAIQLRVGYTAVSAPFNLDGSFPFIHIVEANLEILFKIF